MRPIVGGPDIVPICIQAPPPGEHFRTLVRGVGELCETQDIQRVLAVHRLQVAVARQPGRAELAQWLEDSIAQRAVVARFRLDH